MEWFILYEFKETSLTCIDVFQIILYEIMIGIVVDVMWKPIVERFV